jgi:type II secretion system protein N
MKQLILRAIIYTAWFIFTLLVFLYLTFPTDSLRLVMEAQLQNYLQARFKTEYQVMIEDVSLAGLTGATATRVALYPVVREASGEDGEASEGESDDGTTTGPPVVALPTQIDELTATVDLFGLIGGRLEAAVEATVGGGAVFVVVEPSTEVPGGQHIGVDVENVNLLSLGLLSNLTDGVISGVLSLDLDLHQSGRVIRKGNVEELTITNLVRGAPSPLPIPGVGVDLTMVREAHLGTLTGNVEISEDRGGPRIDLSVATEGGADVNLSANGFIQWSERLADWIPRIEVTMEFQPEWITDNDLDGVFRQREMRRLCFEGTCQFRIVGSFKQLRSEPI